MSLDMTEETVETLAAYIDRVLYGQQGYYSAGKVKFGPDFITYAEKWAPFLANRFYLAWSYMDCLKTFNIYEFGAGTGKMARRILDYVHGRAELEPNSEWPNFYKSLKYIIGEISPELLKLQKVELNDYLLQNKVELYQSDARVVDDKLPRGPGVVVSNELIDAFPPQEITITDEGIFATVVVTQGNKRVLSKRRIEEVLTTEEQAFVKTLVESSQHLWTKPQSFYIQIGIQKYYEKLKSLLTQGYIFTLDYGYDGYHYLNQPDEKKTLRTFSKKHGDGKSFLECPGELDVTCNVNFSALAEVAQQLECNVTYFGMQDSLGGPNISEFRVLIQSMNTHARQSEEILYTGMRRTSPVYFSDLASLTTLLSEGEKLFTALEEQTEPNDIKTHLEIFLNWLEANHYRDRDRAFMFALNEKFGMHLLSLLQHKPLAVYELAENPVYAEILITAAMYLGQRMINEKDPMELILFQFTANTIQKLLTLMSVKHRAMTIKVMNHKTLEDYNLHQLSPKDSLLNKCLAAANKKLAKLNSLAESSKKMGNQHFAQKEYAAAIACYEKALDYMPAFKEAFFNAGLCHTQLNQNEQALICFKKAVAIDPDYKKAVAQVKLLDKQTMASPHEQEKFHH
jgi:SAM-dependent MidA family methyltransferase